MILWPVVGHNCQLLEGKCNNAFCQHHVPCKVKLPSVEQNLGVNSAESELGSDDVAAAAAAGAAVTAAG